MVANQIQIGLMGDFPAVINLIKGRESGKAKTITLEPWPTVPMVLVMRGCPN